MALKTARPFTCAVGLLIAFAGLGTGGASAAGAATYSAKTTAEFVADVGKANASSEASTIVLAAGAYQPAKTVRLTNTTGPLTIEGPSGSPSEKLETAKLDGGDVEPFPSEFFVVEAGVSVTFKDVEITHGGGSGDVPTIEDLGSLGVESSTVAGNTGDGVVVQRGASLTVRNSTLSDGLDFGVVNGGTASIFNSTVAFNKNGGLENKGTLSLTNTIVADNTGSGDCEGKATTSDHSLDSNGSCGVGALSKTNPLLQTSLSNDGGSTPLHSLKPGSPAIGGGDPATCTAADQRGAPRASACSIGADEFSSTPPTIKVPAAPVKVQAEETNEEGEEGETISIAGFGVTATGANAAIREIVCEPQAPGTFILVGDYKEKCTATDGHENHASGEFELDVTKKTTAPPAPPVFNGVPANITVPATSSSGVVVTYTDPTATDPAGGTDPVSCEPASGTTFKIGSTTVTCTATDKAGAGAMATFEVTVTDNPPVFSNVPAPITKEATSSSGAVVSYTDPTATDPAGGTDPVSCVPPSGSTFAIKTTTVTCSATDKADVEGKASFEVTVTPEKAPAGPPVFSNVPAPITKEATSSSGAVVSYTDPTATDPAGGTDPVSCVPPSGSTFAIKTTTVTCSATDKADVEGKASFEVTVTPEKAPAGPPVFSNVPAPITKEATSSSGAVVSYTDPTATDPAGGTDPVSCVPPSGSTFAIKTTTVTCSATDKADVEGKASFEVTVTPEKAPAGPPVFSNVPAPITKEATSSSGAVVSYTDPTATDPAGGTDPVSCVPPSGSTFAIKTTTVTCSATDKADVEGKASFEVTVTPEKAPAGPPVFSNVPAPITKEATSSSGAVVSYTDPTATDPAGGTDPVSCVPPSGSTFAIKTTTVTCSATDKADVEGKASFEVTVTPEKAPAGPPVFSNVPAPITKEATSSSGAVVSYTDPTATDPAGGTDPVSCVPPSGSTFAIKTTTVTCSATDKADVEGKASFEVTVTAQAVGGEPPAVRIDNLLGEVSAAAIPHGIRVELSSLLEDALRSLRPQRGSGGRSRGPAGGAALIAQALSAPFEALTATRHDRCTSEQTYGDLELFIAVVERSEGRRRPQIPPALALAWTRDAGEIAASLECGSHGRAGYIGDW